ncbi:uncharacterized protein LOC107671425 [Sinocyclocheilus anshuiensis]|uniref:uncharacterized protein LOC107671425 n=1 Tax=Sinocyclocheilus anshuiensis TaxID=1608454 RepID=UPI0007BACC03|nr:PREDICTED: uncharacterized protein LOC107671425 [Sinocyclocheilus anshuiensis]
MSHDEDLTVISNPKSKWPVLCQILGFLCSSPMCSVSQYMKGKLTHIHTALGIVQIIISVINIAAENLFSWVRSYSIYTFSHGPFWLGGVFLVVGIVCILQAMFPSTCLLAITMILNVVSTALALTAVVLHSMDLAVENSTATIFCNSYVYFSQIDYKDLPFTTQKQRTKICLDSMMLGGLDIMMIVLSVLQLCVTISFCVLTGKALCKKDEEAKSVEDPELQKPLLEDATAGAA